MGLQPTHTHSASEMRYSPSDPTALCGPHRLSQ